MGGDNTKSSTITTTTTTTTNNDNNRKSRWQSSSSTTTPPTKNPSPSQKPPPTGTPSRPSSNKPTPKHSLTPTQTQTQTQTPSSQSQQQQQQPPFPFSPPPPPSYGFHLLDRRTIVLADSSVRTYFALPPDYQDFTPPPRPRFGPPPHPFKRKFGFGDDADSDAVDTFARQKQQLLQFANAGSRPGPGLPSGTSSPFSRRNDEEYRTNNKYMRFDGGSSTTTTNNNNNVGVDPAVMKAFLNFVKLLNENSTQRKNYLENGKHGPLQCLACARSSKDFQDVHALIMHAYNSENADLRVDHLGLHRALCALMGWNYMRAPDNSRAYQLLPAEEAAAYQNDLIMWPPMVIINNTNTGKGKDGRMEGLGNKAMDSKLRDLGFSAGKSKSLYSRDGHLGITLIKFPSEQSGLKEAMRLAEHFEKEHHGRSDWARVRSSATDRDEESNPNLVMLDQKTGERRRILYGYLATVSDLDKVDYETRKKVVIESKHEKLQTPN